MVLMNFVTELKNTRKTKKFNLSSFYIYVIIEVFFERTYFNSDCKMNTTLCVSLYKQALNKTTWDISLFNCIFFLF